MGYSLRQNDPDGFKFGYFQRFTEVEWNNYQFASPRDLQWFRDAKYGLFIHHGISSLGPSEIGWSRHTHKLPDPGEGDIPDEVYDGWAKQFRHERFNAREWIQSAVNWGMKYIVVITKHHDGFHLWDTQYSEHKITRSPFGRDYLKEIADACHDLGMKLGVYFSQRDWFHPDYEPVDPSAASPLKEAPFWELKPGKTFAITEKHKKYITYLHNAVRELMTNYGKVDLFFWDADYCGGMYTKEMWDTEAIEREIRKLQPGIIIDNRGGLPGDYDTPEQEVGLFRNQRPWETCMSLGPGWSWSGKPPKSRDAILRSFIQCVYGDGNFLLSIGARPDGCFDALDTGRLDEIGQWLKKYGESVYHTRGGPWRPEPWGGSCGKGDTVYLHIIAPEKLESRNGSLFLKLQPLNPEDSGWTKCTHARGITGEEVSILQPGVSGITLEIRPGNLKNSDIVISLTIT